MFCVFLLIAMGVVTNQASVSFVPRKSNLLTKIGEITFKGQDSFDTGITNKNHIVWKRSPKDKENEWIEFSMDGRMGSQHNSEEDYDGNFGNTVKHRRQLVNQDFRKKPVIKPNLAAKMIILNRRDCDKVHSTTTTTASPNLLSLYLCPMAVLNASNEYFIEGQGPVPTVMMPAQFLQTTPFPAGLEKYNGLQQNNIQMPTKGGQNALVQPTFLPTQGIQFPTKEQYNKQMVMPLFQNNVRSSQPSVAENQPNLREMDDSLSLKNLSDIPLPASQESKIIKERSPDVRSISDIFNSVSGIFAKETKSLQMHLQNITGQPSKNISDIFKSAEHLNSKDSVKNFSVHTQKITNEMHSEGNDVSQNGDNVKESPFKLADAEKVKSLPVDTSESAVSTNNTAHLEKREPHIVKLVRNKRSHSHLFPSLIFPATSSKESKNNNTNHHRNRRKTPQQILPSNDIAGKRQRTSSLGNETYSDSYIFQKPGYREVVQEFGYVSAQGDKGQQRVRQDVPGGGGQKELLQEFGNPRMGGKGHQMIREDVDAGQGHREMIQEFGSNKAKGLQITREEQQTGFQHREMIQQFGTARVNASRHENPASNFPENRLVEIIQQFGFQGDGQQIIRGEIQKYNKRAEMIQQVGNTSEGQQIVRGEVHQGGGHGVMVQQFSTVHDIAEENYEDDESLEDQEGTNVTGKSANNNVIPGSILNPQEAPPIQVNQSPLLPVNQPPMLPVNQPPMLPMNQSPMLPMNQPPMLPMNQPPMLPANQPPALPVNQPLLIPVYQPLGKDILQARRNQPLQVKVDKPAESPDNQTSLPTNRSESETMNKNSPNQTSSASTNQTSESTTAPPSSSLGNENISTGVNQTQPTVYADELGGSESWSPVKLKKIWKKSAWQGSRTSGAKVIERRSPNTVYSINRSVALADNGRKSNSN